MKVPNRLIRDAFNHELQREQQYDTEVSTDTVPSNVPQLDTQRRIAYDTLIEAVNSGSGGIYFFNASRGTGKTFLISLLLAKIRSKNEAAPSVGFVWNSYNIIRRSVNYTFCLEITIKHANQQSPSLQHRQKQCNNEDSTNMQIDRLR
ncbi:hypothetical protein EVAR_48281_1 [Eumeta japonica]|uniref:ATP-dependent DNA helicase n=1 Tax=Eumeta variegata TaxID=151549 RepID=A0A4C1WJR1_EUMVA|nr:hypothetical protein EVAR_48281_1 [Eumeta japonica]